jgi:hypothetical protein
MDPDPTPDATSLFRDSKDAKKLFYKLLLKKIEKIPQKNILKKVITCHPQAHYLQP